MPDWRDSFPKKKKASLTRRDSDAVSELDAEVMPRTISKLTPSVQDEILREAETTPSVNQIAARVGVSYRTLRHWIQLGEEGDERYAGFAAALAQARAKHEDKYIRHLEEIAADDNPRTANARLRATESLLRKLFPKQWGDELWVKTMVERDVDGMDLSVLPQTALRELMKMHKVVRAKRDGADDKEIKRLIEKIKVPGLNDDE